MRRMIAWAAYVLGAVIGLKSVITGLAGGGLFDAFGGIAYGIVAWWIAVGIGVRLGVTPDEFVASIVHFLGFGRGLPDNEADPAPGPTKTEI
ncbi:MAG: hypothetical protein ACRDKT_06445 [Actinomycetota bacterium]